MLRLATTALAALCLLTACGSSTGGPVGSGGEGGPPGGGGEEGKRAEALFDAAKAASLRTLTGSTRPGESAAENDRRRRAQDRDGWQGRRATLLQGAGSGEGDDAALEEFVVEFSDRYDDVSLRNPLLFKGDIVVHGARADGTRFLGATMDHAGFAVFATEDYRDGGIYARTDFAPSAPASTPGGTATWTGLMLGADRDSLDLLQGDADIQYDLEDNQVDVRFTGIVNLDEGGAYSKKPEEAFLDIDVDRDGTWATPEGHIEGAFAGPGHEEAVGLFWTPDMMGAFGAKRE